MVQLKERAVFWSRPLTRVDRAAVNAPPKVRRSKHKHLLLKVTELALSRFFRDPGGTLVGRVSHGPVSVTLRLIRGGSCSRRRCAALLSIIQWGEGEKKEKKKKVHFLPCCVSLP